MATFDSMHGPSVRQYASCPSLADEFRRANAFPTTTANGSSSSTGSRSSSFLFGRATSASTSSTTSWASSFFGSASLPTPAPPMASSPTTTGMVPPPVPPKDFPRHKQQHQQRTPTPRRPDASAAQERPRSAYYTSASSSSAGSASPPMYNAQRHRRRTSNASFMDIPTPLPRSRPGSPVGRPNSPLPEPATTPRAPQGTEAERMIAEILRTQSYYAVLGVSRSASFDEIRRAYLLDQKSRSVHPDKHPGNPLATQAFQKISSAYTTLKQAGTRAAYDLAGEQVQGNGDETLYTTLVQLWCEFMEGHFDNLLMIADLLQAQHPQISRESLEAMLSTTRATLLTCTHCLSAARPKFFDALDLHTQLTNLSYLDLTGRLSLSLRLLQVLLSIPLTVHETAGGTALPQFTVAMLHLMLGMLDSGMRATGRVADVAERAGEAPRVARKAIEAVVRAGPLKVAASGIGWGIGAVTGAAGLVGAGWQAAGFGSRRGSLASDGADDHAPNGSVPAVAAN
ncbi:hypothetical protein BC828DRAFT_401862 [Blastocladiella britannica]|nr:hypothetical protein BC828DRAFT_401862 [Blastocladiella britannica]